MNYFVILEILSEEIPPFLQEMAAKQLAELFKLNSANYFIYPQNINYYFSAQRICFTAELNIEIKINEIIIKGPKIDIAEEILQAFLKKNNASKNQLIQIENKWALSSSVALNDSIEAILHNLQLICKTSLEKFTWPKSMLWQNNNIKWIRPIKNNMAILEINNRPSAVISFEFAGIQSSNFTYGHKILNFNHGNSPKISIDYIKNYSDKLKENFVIIDPMERKNKILNECQKIKEFKGVSENLIEEITNICEYPKLLVCEIKDDFLHLPNELISYVMISHQRYIPLFNDDLSLNKKFIVIIDHNNPTEEMKYGYEKVLHARLLDAKFFYERFLNEDLDSLIDKLKMISSEDPTISIYAQNKKIIEKIALMNLANSISVDYLNEIKCDLASELINEYPALRGIMAGYYLKNNEKKAIIAKNIYFGTNEIYDRDNLQDNLEARLIGVADRIIRLEYFFLIKNENPSGSRDPFALKRSVHNIIDFILSFEGLDFDLLKIIDKNHEKSASLIEFIKKIFIDYIGNENKNILELIVNEQKHNLNLLQIRNFADYLAHLEISEELIKAYKRISQIYNKKYKETKFTINENLFETTQEKKLFDLINLIKNKKIDEILNLSLKISEAINNFLDKIRIETDNEELKTNRIALITEFFRRMEGIFYFEKLFSKISIS